MNRLQAAQQLRRLLQILCKDLTEEMALEVPAVFDPWQAGRSYGAGEWITYGENAVGDPQLYRVVQTHTSQGDWTPDAVPALYVALGLDGAGIPLWSRPAGAHDAYGAGDIVSFEGLLYQSLLDGNVYSPAEYPQGWCVKE